MNVNGVTSTIAGGIATITLVRPPHNFFDVEMISTIADIIAAGDADPAVRVYLLVSETKTFCAGADFSGGQRPDPRPIYDHAVRVTAHRKPMVAAIGGAAVGGGLGLALTADLRVGSTQSWFQANFVRIGISPGFGLSRRLPQVVGAQHARDLFLTGRRVDAEEALMLGLIDRRVEPERLRDAASELASELAIASPAALDATRRLLGEGERSGFAAAIARELTLQRPLFAAPDFAEGVAAAQQRRMPRFADFEGQSE